MEKVSLFFDKKANKFLGLISIFLGVIGAISLFTDFNIELINNLFGKYGVLMIALLLVLIIVLLYLYTEKIDRINTLEYDLRDKTKEVWKSYSELNQFYKDQQLQNLMRIYVTNSRYVCSIQRYHFTFYEERDHVLITIKGLNHFVRPNEDLNTISQAYFKYNKSEIEELTYAYELATRSTKTKKTEDDNPDLLVKFIIEKSTLLGNQDNYLDEHVFTYQLVKLAHEALEKKYKMGLDFPIPVEIEQQILAKKKSGVDIAIFILLNKGLKINQNKSIFDYSGKTDSKQGRIYTNILVENNIKEQFVFVITSRLNGNWGLNYQREQVKEDGEYFISLLPEKSYKRLVKDRNS